MFEMKALPENKKTEQFFKEIPERTIAFKKAVGYYATLHLLEEIKKNIKPSNETKDYIDSLQQVLISQSDTKEFLFAVTINKKARKVKKLDVNKSIIEIKAIRRMGKADPKAATLEKFNPWTLDTIPFLPDKKSANIITTKSSSSYVNKVSKLRNKDKPTWKKELIRIGVPEKTFSNKLEISPNSSKAIPNVALEGLRMEFGLDGNESSSHWKRALSELASSGLMSIMQDKKLDRILNDATYSEWKNIPNAKSRITMREARDFESFMKQLNIVQ